MKKLFLAAALTAACSLSAIADDNNDARYKWSTENCKDAGVTTSVNNRYNMGGNDANVQVNNIPNRMETFTTIENKRGETTQHYKRKNDSHDNKFYESEYEVNKATTECRWTK